VNVHVTYSFSLLECEDYTLHPEDGGSKFLRNVSYHITTRCHSPWRTGLRLHGVLHIFKGDLSVLLRGAYWLTDRQTDSFTVLFSCYLHAAKRDSAMDLGEASYSNPVQTCFH